jgi:DNA modification methylase
MFTLGCSGHLALLRGDMSQIKIAFDPSKLRMVDPETLIVDPRNRNKHPPEQIDRFCKLLKEYGMRWPILVSERTGVIKAGEGRLLAALKLKMPQVLVSYQEFDSDIQEYGFGISDNAIASWAELDLSSINTDIKEWGSGFDIDLLGIKDFELVEPELVPGCDEDEVPEPKESICKLGDVWQLGSHRLMCGDSTSIDAVENLMNGEKADMTFSSPPYNAGKNIRGNFYENDSDDKSEDEYADFLSAVTSNCLVYSDFVFINLQILESNKRALIKYQYRYIDQLKDILVWNKKQYPPHINKGTFGCKWEYVFAFAQDGKSRSFPCQWQGKYSNVIETENNSGNEFAEAHRAGFPVSFPEWMIGKMDFSKSVIDPFGGTGTTLIACEKTRRRCFMMELDPHYCDVIIARWEKYTGKKAELWQDQESKSTGLNSINFATSIAL